MTLKRHQGLQSSPKCAHCGKRWGDHKAKTQHCPTGKRHRTLGYSDFDKTQTYAPKRRPSPKERPPFNSRLLDDSPIVAEVLERQRAGLLIAEGDGVIRLTNTTNQPLNVSVTVDEQGKATFSPSKAAYLKAQPKPPKPARSPAYRAYINRQRCCNCGAPAPSEAHHEGRKGVGQKCSDFRTGPLCNKCHKIRTRENVLPEVGPRNVFGEGQILKTLRTREESLRIMQAAQLQYLTRAVHRIGELISEEEAIKLLDDALAKVDEKTLRKALK